jgi:hypothetical protein
MWIWSTLAWAAPPACPSGTTAVFRCADATEYALLCAGPTLEAPRTLQYVHGKTGRAPDMLWPKVPSMDAFGFFGQEGASYAVRFVNNGYAYRLWAEISMIGMPTGGLTVEHAGARVAEMSCHPELEAEGFFSELKRDPLAENEPPAAPSPPPLCTPDQDNLLTCKVKDKILSVCSTADGLQYRYGPPGKPELVTPAAPALQGVSFEINQGAHAATRAVSFAVQDIEYRVWSFEPDSGCCGDLPAAGVEVKQKGSVLTSLQCTGSVWGGFSGEDYPWKAP